MAQKKPSLRIVLFLAFSLTSLLPIIALYCWEVRFARDNEYSVVTEKHLLVAKNMTLALSRYVQDVEAVLTLVSNQPIIENNTPFKALLASQNITAIWVFNHDKEPKQAISIGLPPVLSLTAAQYEAASAVADTDEMVFLPVQLNSNHQPRILVVSPYPACSGYLVAEIDPQYIKELQQKIQFGKQGHSAIVDQAGNVLAHPNSEWEASVKNIAKVSAVRRMMNREVGVQEFFSPAKLADMIAGFSFVPETGWGVMVPQPIAELEENIAHLESTTMKIGALAWFLVTLLSWVLASKLTRPIREVAEMANTMVLIDDVEAVSLVPSFTREQHELSDAFSRMTHRLHASNKQLLYSAQYDALTDLANGYSLNKYMTEKIKQGERFSLILVGVHGLKDINDYWSHAHGDAIIRTAGDRVVDTVNERGFVARLSAGEFAVVLDTSISSSEDVENIVLLIAEALQKNYLMLGEALRVEPKIGIADYPKDADNLEDMRQCVDLAMSAAVDTSHVENLFKWYQPEMRLALNARVELTQALREAIVQQEFVVHYQPQIDPTSYQITGLEALVRWNHPTKGLVFPGDFIELVENTGLIIPLGRLILSLACEDLSRWKQQGIAPQKVSINLSARQFEDNYLADMIASLIAEYKISEGELEFEITESVFVDNGLSVQNTLKKLSKAGHQISIDDFGTGESSLARLKDFEVDTVKIDKSFIDDLETDKKSVRILECISNMAQVLDLDVVVEGVETAGQLTVVRQIGCTQIQGFIFSRGVDAATAGELLTKGVMLPLVK